MSERKGKSASFKFGAKVTLTYGLEILNDNILIDIILSIPNHILIQRIDNRNEIEKHFIH